MIQNANQAGLDAKKKKEEEEIEREKRKRKKANEDSPFANGNS